MFREPSDAEREADLAGVGEDVLLLPDEDYSAFVRRRLAYWPIVVSIGFSFFDYWFDNERSFV